MMKMMKLFKILLISMIKSNRINDSFPCQHCKLVVFEEIKGR